MKKLTRHQMVVNALLQEGQTELPFAGRKYRKFTSWVPGLFYYVGKQGAFRYGKNVAESQSLTRFLPPTGKKAEALEAVESTDPWGDHHGENV